MIKSSFILLIMLTIFNSPNGYAKSFLVSSVDELNQIQPNVQPGDSILFSNKTWMNAQIKLTVSGTETMPIWILPQTVGGVIFSGASALKFSGSYLRIEGFVFKDIYSTAVIVEYRTDKNNLANNCRVSNCVIDNCNPANRLSESNWIALFGKNNRFDHNTMLNKKNLGTTLIVELNDIRNQENNHRIDHNYFGPLERGGSNSFEIIRVGNSTFSRTSSKTIVEDNYFDRCNGEVEIISVKSCDNILRRNTFFECEGGLVLRHGHRNLCDENYFIGNHKIHTGGIRVINAGQKVTNNVFYKLDGERFRSALTIMNGVPNSPIHRYDQVTDATIDGNIFIDCKNVEFCGGKDFERIAKPSNVLFTNNTIFSSSANTTFTVNDDIKGIKFENNISSQSIHPLPAAGFKISPIKYSGENNSWQLNGKTYKAYATPTNTGADFYDKSTIKKITPGKKIEVAPGINTLYEKALLANDGDTLQLISGEYPLSKIIEINKKIVINGTGTNLQRPLIQYTGEHDGFSFFSIENGGTLSLSNVRCNGLSENGVAENFIRTSTKGMIDHYKLFVDGCDFMNITDNRKYTLKVNKGSFADTIQFKNCLFHNQSGEVISIAAEKEDKGFYNAEYVGFINCVFNEVLLGAIDVYRGGNDESTTGYEFTMDHCTFNEVGNAALCSVVRVVGVQNSTYYQLHF